VDLVDEICERYGLIWLRDEKRGRWYLATGPGQPVLLEVSDLDVRLVPARLLDERVVKALTSQLW
jgi:hypothetical protein